MDETVLKQLSQLLERLEKLSRLRLLAGENIRITENEEDAILISAPEQELPEKLKQWLLEADERLRQIPVISAGEGLILEEAGPERRLRCSPENIREETPATVIQSRSETEVHPFKVVQEGTDESNQCLIRVLGYNAEAERFFRNYVFAGCENALEIPECTFSISASSWIYVKVRWNGEYIATVECNAQLPKQSPELYIVPIAYLHLAESLKITQLHFGNVEICGRIV